MARDLLKGDGLTRATPTSGISQSFDAVARLRVHRAISWIGRAEGEATDLDARYLFYWIAFNAAYADERDVRGEREAFAWFFGQLRDQDDQNRIYDMVAHSGASGRSFRQHPVRDSGVSGHLGVTPLSLVS